MARKKQDEGDLLLRERDETLYEETTLVPAGLALGAAADEMEEDEEKTGPPVDVKNVGHQKARYLLTGVSPLVMHSGVLADPLSPEAKALKKATSKKQKTDADHEMIAKTEFKGGLYLHADHGPVVEGAAIEAMLIEAAKKVRRGQQAKAGIIVDGFFPLIYEGPRDPEALWEAKDEKGKKIFVLTVGVRVQRNRVMRSRGIFREWLLEVTVDYEPTTINKSEVDEIMQIAGKIIGLLDWRPKYGRFDVKVL